MARYKNRALALIAMLLYALTSHAFAAAGDMILPPSMTLHWVTPFEQGNQSVVYAKNDNISGMVYVLDGQVIQTERETPALQEASPVFAPLRVYYPGPAWWFDETRPTVVLDEDGGFSLVSADGAVLVPPGRYDGGGFKEGDGSAIGVYKADENGGNQYGLLDLLGQEILPCRYDEIFPIVLSGTPIRVGLRGADGEMRYGYADWNGKLITPIQYEAVSEAYSFDSDRARVAIQSEGGALLYGYIDKTGREVIPCTYARAGLFRGGYAVVGQWDGENWRYGIIDGNGQIILPIAYEAVDYAGQWTLEETLLYGDYVWVRQNGMWGIFQLRDHVKPVAAPIAYNVVVDGTPVTLDAYTVKDADGYDTNFAKLRDVAHILNHTPAQFDVIWEGGAIQVTPGAPYSHPNGYEMVAPFSGARRFHANDTFGALRVNNIPYEAGALHFTDDGGGGHTYFRLRDLGQLLGFSVEWDGEAGVVRIETGVR